MPTPDDIRQQQELLATHRRTLAHFVNQQAIHSSGYAPPVTTHGIHEARTEIARIKGVLRGWGVTVEDMPDDGDGAVDGICSHSEQVQNDTIFSADARQRYCTNLCNKCSDVRVVETTTPQKLNTIWTDVYLIEDPSAMQTLSRHTPKERLNGKKFVMQHDTARIVVLGKPGSGKTTFCKHLVCQAAQGVIDRIPIFIEMTKWDVSRQSLIEYIEEEFTTYGVPDARYVIEHILNEGNALVLFDGFDEVPDQYVEQATRALERFSNQYGTCLHLITCRVAAIKRKFERFTYVELVDFDDEQRYKVISNWFADDPSKRDALLGKLKHAPGVWELAQTPLLLALICLVFDKRGYLEPRQTDLYDKATDILLEEWDEDRGIQRTSITRRVSITEKKSFLSFLAYKTFSTGTTLFEQPVLVAYVDEFFSAKQSAGLDGREFVDAFVAHHGILAKHKRKTYTFSHATFQEYFTARYLVDTSTEHRWLDVISQYIGNHRWHEVFLFSASMLTHTDTDAFLRALQYVVHDLRGNHDSEAVSESFFGGERRRQLVLFLEKLAYHRDDYVSHCCDLLWALGCNDPRLLHNHPDHAIQILQEIAQYHPRKPSTFNDRVLNAVAQWFHDPTSHNHVYSPLDILDTLLVKDDRMQRVEGDRFVITQFFVHRENTRAIRYRALSLVMECTESQDTRVVRRALQSLERALARPGMHTGISASEEKHLEWEPDQEDVLTRIADLIERLSCPMMHIHLWKLLIESSYYHLSERLRPEALRLVSMIPNTFEVRLLKSLILVHWLDYCVREEDRHSHNVHLHSIDRHWYQAVAQEFHARYPDASDGVHVLNTFLDLLHTHGYTQNLYPALFTTLSYHVPSYAISMLHIILETPECSLAHFVYSLYLGIRIADRETALSLAHRAVHNGHEVVCMSLAQAYCSTEWLETFHPKDAQIIHALLHHAVPAVQHMAIGTLRNLGTLQPRTAIMYARDIDVDNNLPLAHELFMLFDESSGIHVDTLTDEDIDAFVAKILVFDDIGEYHIRQFLAYVAGRRPHDIVQFLCDRIASWEQQKRRTYRPLPDPYGPHELKLETLGAVQDYPDIVRCIRDRALEHLPTHWLSILFRVVSLCYCPESLDILAEWIDTQDRNKIRAASKLLSHVPQDFVFSQQNFVVHLIEQAYAIDERCYEEVMDHVRLSVIWYSVPPAVCKSDYLVLRDQAQAVVSELSPETPAYQFYSKLVTDAEHWIQDDMVER